MSPEAQKYEDQTLKEMRIALKEGVFSLGGRMSPADELAMEGLMPIGAVDSDRRIYKRLIKGLLRFERTEKVGGSLPVEETLETAAIELQQLKELFASKGMKISAKTMEGIMLYQGCEYWVEFLESDLFRWALTASPSRLKQQIARRPMMLIPHLTVAKEAYDAVMSDPDFEWLHSTPSLVANAAIAHGEKALEFFEDIAGPTFETVTSEGEYAWMASEKGFLRQMCVERPHQICGLLVWAEGEISKMDTDSKYSWIVGRKGGQKSLLAKQLIKAPKAFEARMAEAKSVYDELMANPNLMCIFGGKSLVVRAVLTNPKRAKRQVKEAGWKFTSIIRDPNFAWLIGVSGSVRAVRYLTLEKLMFGASVQEVTEGLANAEHQFERALALVRNRDRISKLKQEVDHKIQEGSLWKVPGANMKRWLDKMMRLKLTQRKIDNLKSLHLYLDSAGVVYPPELLLAHSRRVPSNAHRKVEKLLALGFSAQEVSDVLRSNIQVLSIGVEAIASVYAALDEIGQDVKRIFVRYGVVVRQNANRIVSMRDDLWELCGDRNVAEEMIARNPRILIVNKQSLLECINFIAENFTDDDMDVAVECVVKNPFIIANGKDFERVKSAAMGIIEQQGSQESASKVVLGNPWSLNRYRSSNDAIYAALAQKAGVHDAAAYVEAFPGLLKVLPDEARGAELSKLMQRASQLLEQHRVSSVWRDRTCTDYEIDEEGGVYSRSDATAFNAFYEAEWAAFG